MNHPQKFSWRQRLLSFANAIRGIQDMLKTQHNAWLHAVATVLVCATGFAFGVSKLEWCVLVLGFATVWMAEALNTAVELLTDLVSPSFHPLAGRAKDAAAGAVLIAAIGSAIAFAIVLLPHAWQKLIGNG